jgi:hypothetical protein
MAWSREARQRHSQRMKAWFSGTGPAYDPEGGLGHIDRAPRRTFEECWARARRGAPPCIELEVVWVKVWRIKR